VEPNLIVLLAVCSLIGLLLVGVPISISLASSGIVGLLLLRGADVTGSVIAGTTYTAVAKGSLIVVPMFVLMGMFTLHSGIAERLFAIASRGLKWLPGGLGIATVFSAAGFGAISGSSLATVATLGRTCITEMMRHGYQRQFAAATVAVSGTLAVLIPPSIILILYGVITGESIGSLLIAGIIPGILSALVLGAMVCLRAWRTPSLVNSFDAKAFALATGDVSTAPVAAAAAVGSARAASCDRQATVGRDVSDGASVVSDVLDEVEPEGARSGPPMLELTLGGALRAVVGVVVLFTIVIGGIYSGVFTPTESAAVGAFAAFLLMCLQYRSRPRELGRKTTEALRETVSLNAMIFMILIGAGIFSFFLVSAGTPSALSAAIVEMPLPPTLIVIFLLLFLVPLGMFLDSISLLVITVPLVYGPITDLGFDGIWLGILVVKLIEIGMVTPPVGMNAFVTAGTIRGLEIDEVFRGLIPFYLADVILVAMFFAMPDLVTWLPELMGT
jgi:C4-dicarboxylate transporter, DctM subunit